MAVAIACDGNGSSSKKLIPRRTNLVVSIEFDEVVSSTHIDFVPILQTFASVFPSGPDGNGEFLTHGQAAAFISDRDIGRMDSFCEVDATEFGGHLGVAPQGNFDEAALTVEIESVSVYKLAREVYKGINGYWPLDGTDEVVLRVLDPETFAVGTGRAINDIMDLWVGDADSASGPMIDVFNDLDDGVFALAAKVPQDALEGGNLSSLTQIGDLPISLNFIFSLDVVGLGGDLNNGTMHFTATMDFTNREAAESTHEFVSGIVTLASGWSDDSATADLFDGLEVGQDGRRPTIKTGAPRSELE